MNDWKNVIINKNRGWRGLAEATVINETGVVQRKLIFSFSQAIWDDLMDYRTIVIPDEKYYHVVELEDKTGKLPSPSQQRSVLIKNYIGSVKKVNSYLKSEWTAAEGTDWSAIRHFLKNRNNHTTSDWNCIGIRVIPEI